jgi:hypothetical protein
MTTQRARGGRDERSTPLVSSGVAASLPHRDLQSGTIECDQLGAQKQVAGGGRYPEGIGWAIGLDRLLLALE